MSLEERSVSKDFLYNLSDDHTMEELYILQSKLYNVQKAASLIGIDINEVDERFIGKYESLGAFAFEYFEQEAVLPEHYITDYIDFEKAGKYLVDNETIYIVSVSGTDNQTSVYVFNGK